MLTDLVKVTGEARVDGFGRIKDAKDGDHVSIDDLVEENAHLGAQHFTGDIRKPGDTRKGKGRGKGGERAGKWWCGIMGDVWRDGLGRRPR